MSECNAFDGVKTYFKMKFYFFLAAVFLSKLTSRVIALDEDGLSPLVLTRYHRRLKGFTFNIFHSASLVYCALECRRNPRCFSTNFRKAWGNRRNLWVERQRSNAASSYQRKRAYTWRRNSLFSILRQEGKTNVLLWYAKQNNALCIQSFGEFWQPERQGQGRHWLKVSLYSTK